MEKCDGSKYHDEAVELIKSLQPIRDSYAVGSEERDAIQRVINNIMYEHGVSSDEVPCKFTTGPDMVNRPPHYNVHALECFDEMLLVFPPSAVFAYCVLNAWKYRYRADAKGKPQQDNAKADWYLSKAKHLVKDHGASMPCNSL